MGSVDEAADVTFTLADPAHRFAGVRLWQEVGVPGDRLDLAWTDGVWRVAVPHPGAHRMEYLFEVTHPDGGRELVVDPDNPSRVGTAFGDHSVVEFAGYAAPAWLAADAPAGTWDDVEVPAPALAGSVHARLWSAAGLRPADAAPLLVVHDGPEYDALAGLTRYLAVSVAAGDVPPLRAALLGPGDRDRWYAADAAYATVLAGSVVPALRDMRPATCVVGMGTSLGALAWLHAHRTHPDVADALFLQSGSFFTPDLDPQERWFGGFDAVTAAVAEVHAASDAASRAVRPVPVAMTCGTVEENLANNRRLAASLAAQGYPVTLTEVPDAHNYVAWRDAFAPDLAALVRRVAAAGRGRGTP